MTCPPHFINHQVRQSNCHSQPVNRTGSIWNRASNDGGCVARCLEHRAWVPIPDLSWTSCVALDKSPKLSVSLSLKWVDGDTDVA